MTRNLAKRAVDRSVSVARVLKWAAIIGFAELRNIYTWRTWTFGWLGRMIAQVIFFSLLGDLVGSQDRVRYLLIGNAVMVACVEASLIVATTSGERLSGTLPLLVATPHGYITSLLGRGFHWLCTGLAGSTIVLGVSAGLLGVPLAWPEVALVPPLTLLTAFGVYTLGAFIASFAMWFPQLSLPIMNITYLTMMAICGVMVPVAFWPAPIRAIATVLPLTHGLSAVRGVLNGVPGRAVAGQAALEALVAGCWMLVAVLSYRGIAHFARRNGAITFEP